MGRFVWVAFLGLWAQIGTPQTLSETDPDKVAPQVVINVRKHPMGADMVDVTCASARYPKDLLQAQCEKIGQAVNSPARGLVVYVSGNEPKFQFVKASFATDNIIDREKGTIDLQALVRSFLGAPEPNTVQSFLITLEGEVPVDKQTLQDYASDTVRLKASVSTFPKGLEYRVLALTQNPEKLTIPGRFVEPKPSEKSSQKGPQGQTSWLQIALLTVAGIAGVALVYFAVSGRGRSSQGRSKRRT